MTKSDLSAEIRAVIETRAEAIRNKDLSRALAVYTPDVVNFDLPPPLRFVGAAALDPKGLGGWFDTWAGPIGLDLRDFQVVVEGDIAFAHGLVRIHGKRTGGESTGKATDVWVRQTLGFRRVAGAWKIAHEHTSVPFYMDGSFRAAVDLKP